MTMSVQIKLEITLEAFDALRSMMERDAQRDKQLLLGLDDLVKRGMVTEDDPLTAAQRDRLVKQARERDLLHKQLYEQVYSSAKGGDGC